MRAGALMSGLVVVFCQLLVVLPRMACALEPPRPGEIEQLKQTGEYADRLEQVVALGNHRIDSGLLEQAIYRAQREALIQQDVNPDDVLPAPPPSRRLMPTTGNVEVFALLIDFLDYPAYSTQSAVDSALFGDGSGIPTNSFPYESLANYYARSSYGQLDLSYGMTLGWYHAPYNRSSVPQTTAGREALIKEAIAAFDGAVDFSQFNNDTSDNKIEYFAVIWTGPNNGWGNFWWGYQTSWGDSSYTVDGVTLGRYSWQWEGDYGSYGPFDPIVVIHETGHGLGLPDYYDYDDSVGPDGGVGGLDMMDGNWGDHNSFSKWVLEWIAPAVVASGSQTLTLDPSGTSQDAVLIMPGATSTDAFREFFIAQNRYRVGNDPSSYPTDGMLIWHVDARLDARGRDYEYDNSWTAHKLLKLMQADGLDRIENLNVWADAAMYYDPGTSLSPLTVPSSWSYLGVDTGVNVTGISQSWPQMTATFSIDDPRLFPTLTVTKAGNGRGTVTSSDGGISLGSDGQESYVPGTTVMLSAVPAPGSIFAGWSGGGSGTATRTITMSTDTTVTATFTTTLLLDEDFDPVSTDPPVGWTEMNTAGSSNWYFTYDAEYNLSGGSGVCATGWTYGSGPYDSELRTFAMDLSAYNSVGLEFKTHLGSSVATADVDVSVNGSAGPWTNVWRTTGYLIGPQTVNVDLTSTAAGQGNVMLRFRHYGTSIYWLIDDVKVIAAGMVTPLVDFTAAPTSGYQPLLVTFTDTSQDSPTSWSWTFGDGGTSTARNPSHTYTDADSYTVSLTATNAAGSDTETKVGYIVVSMPPPVADFTAWPTGGTVPLLVTFTDVSSNSPTSWSWTFGDGGTSPLQHPSHTYVGAGSYTVSLTAANAGGSDTETKVDYVSAGLPPAADFTGSPTNGYEPLLVTFIDTSLYSPTSWSWTFGDGGTSSLQHPSHTYVGAGSYTVSLTATNASGSSTETKDDYVIVTARPHTWYVDDAVASSGDGASWETAFKMIQEGVNAASSGDVILIAGGRYPENVVIDRDLVIEGMGPGRTVVAPSSGASAMEVVSGASAILRAFTIDGSGELVPDGVTAAHASVQVEDVEVKLCRHAFEVLGATGFLSIDSSVIGGCGTGVFCGAGIVEINRCTISQGDRGVGIWGIVETTILNTVITDHSEYGVYRDQNPDVPMPGIAFSDVWRNETDYAGCSPGVGCISSDPFFVDPVNGDYRLGYGSPCINAGTSDGINPDGVTDIGAFPVGTATVGLYAPGTARCYGQNSHSGGSADISFRFGAANWKPVTGDWDADVDDTAGVYVPATGTFFLKNIHAGGTGDISFRFGPSGVSWTPLAGDWDGDGMDTVGLYDPAGGRFYLRNAHAGGAADVSFNFGPKGLGWLPITGDWDGDGIDTIGLYDPVGGRFYLRNIHAGGSADVSFGFGAKAAGWLPLAGDWDANGTDTVGLYAPSNSTFYLKNSHTGGTADISFRFGPAPSTWIPIAGDWDGM